MTASAVPRDCPKTNAHRFLIERRREIREDLSADDALERKRRHVDDRALKVTPPNLASPLSRAEVMDTPGPLPSPIDACPEPTAAAMNGNSSAASGLHMIDVPPCVSITSCTGFPAKSDLDAGKQSAHAGVNAVGSRHVRLSRGASRARVEPDVVESPPSVTLP